MIIGIDLGTTNSLVACYKEDGPRIIPNRLGKFLTPSVVSVDEQGNVLVGETALERMSLYPDTVAMAFKRSMGSEREYTLQGKPYKPEELSSFILRVLKEDAQIYLKEEVTEAIISVPAYFDEKRRRATKRAASLAGLRVERLISEPTAAAIAYGLYEKKGNNRFLVFDLGGGTFDVSILELFENILEVRSVAGDNYLGGEDFTAVLEKLFLKKVGMDKSSLTSKEQIRLYKRAEKAKCQLNDKSEIKIQCIIGEENKIANVTVKEYEDACEELLQKIRKPIQRSLSDAGLSLRDIDQVVFIGGATKLQICREYFIRLFRKFPDTSINPEEAVALGAAIQGAMKERKEEVREMIMTDVCSFTLGTEVVQEYGDGVIKEGYYSPIIDRNTIIPVSKTSTFYTAHDNQTKIRITILQGESRFAANNLYLGELSIEVPKGPKGKEAVEVTYTYDINSLLEVEVKVVSTGIKKKMVIKGSHNTMTEEEVEKRMEELSYLKIQLRDQEENKLALLRAERMYEETTGEDRKRLERAILRFEEALHRGERSVVDKERKTLYEVMGEME